MVLAEENGKAHILHSLTHTQYLCVHLLNDTNLIATVSRVSPPYPSNILISLLFDYRIAIWKSWEESRGGLDLALLLMTLNVKVNAYLEKENSAYCHFKVQQPYCTLDC